MSATTIDDVIFMFRAKRPLYLRHFRLDATAETDASDQRGRRKTAELHTSGAKREVKPKLVRVRKVMRGGPRQGGGVGGCSSGVVCEKHIVGSDFLGAGGHTHVSNIRWGSL